MSSDLNLISTDRVNTRKSMQLVYLIVLKLYQNKGQINHQGNNENNNNYSKINNYYRISAIHKYIKNRKENNYTEDQIFFEVSFINC